MTPISASFQGQQKQPRASVLWAAAMSIMEISAATLSRIAAQAIFVFQIHQAYSMVGAARISPGVDMLAAAQECQGHLCCPQLTAGPLAWTVCSNK